MDTEQLISEQLEIAPDEIRNYLAEGGWRDVVAEISDKNNLSQEQRVSFENEVLIVLLGLDLASNFKTNIQNSLGILEVQANDIDVEIQEKVFAEVAQWLPKEIEEEDATPEVTAETPLAGSAPPRPPLSEEPKWWEQQTGQVGEMEIKNQELSGVPANLPTGDEGDRQSAPDNQQPTSGGLNLYPTRGVRGTEEKEQTTHNRQQTISPSEPVTENESVPSDNERQVTINKQQTVYSRPVETSPLVQSARPQTTAPSQEAISSPEPGVGKRKDTEGLIGIMPESKSPLQAPAPSTKTAPEQKRTFFDRVVQSSPQEKPQSTNLEEKLSQISKDEVEWQKKKAVLDNQVMRSEYPQGQDPYREPFK
jgi:hypothetical protein